MEKENGKEQKKKSGRKFTGKQARRFMAVMDVLSVLLLAAGLFFGIRYLINEHFLSEYQKGRYATASESGLLRGNSLMEGYVPKYNLGNAAYNQEKYDNAIAYYRSALTHHAPRGKDCSIRINLALAMLHKIDFDHISTEKDIEEAIAQLLTARQVLTENGCAGEKDDSGHSKEAEQLKKDIDREIEKLRQESQQQESQENSGNPRSGSSSGGQDNSQSRKEDDIQKALEEQRREAGEQHREAEDEQQQEQQGNNASGNSGSVSGDSGEEQNSGRNW